jgi:hypothetical protein
LFTLYTPKIDDLDNSNTGELGRIHGTSIVGINIVSKNNNTAGWFGWLVAGAWCWFVMRKEYCWLVAAGCWWLVRSERKVLLVGG